jgi:hypothetical protein
LLQPKGAISENTVNSRRSAPPKSSLPPDIIVATARENGVVFRLSHEGDLFTLEWRGPVDPLIEAAILANYEAILGVLRREAGLAS